MSPMIKIKCTRVNPLTNLSCDNKTFTIYVTSNKEIKAECTKCGGVIKMGNSFNMTKMVMD